MKSNNYTVRFDRNILRFFRSAPGRTRVDLATTLFLLRTCVDQQRAVWRRSLWMKCGVQVPPMMIVSITNRCNLNCAGCYARAIHPEPETEMSEARLFELGDEADELGISIVLVAGGEPLLRPAFFDLAKRHPRILFLVFTNGLLINDEILTKFEATRNLIPMLSLEGRQMETDLRRGSGIYKLVEQKMDLLRERGLFFGTSLTLTRSNYDLLTSIDFQKNLNRLGSRVSIFVDYVPVKQETEDLLLTAEQKRGEADWMKKLQENVPGLFVSLPGDEEQYGGCLAGGRGFIHVNPQGRLEACPFAPYSDTNLSQMSLKEALGSRLMRVIRENANRLSESRGGCALWENRDWVLEQMDKISNH
jgi:MoaA/NifB/PqqE/SkfB family radical SAM enzyme